MDLRIRITPEVAERLLEDLPGGRDLWDAVTDAYLAAQGRA